MAKQRAKRANRANPRVDRNEQQNNRSRGKSNTTEFSFPKRPKKQKIEIIPRNLNQEELLVALENHNKNIVFAVGPAGCGKTLIATLHAIKALKEGSVEKIVITRPNVAVDDKDIGYLPGDILKKMTPWMMPILDVFSEYFTQEEIKSMLEENIIEMVPIAFIRGRTFKNSYILIDEAQGTTINSMLSILTRIGENSKMVVTGDVAQSDRGRDNGLSDFINRFSKSSDRISLIQFVSKDVERHPVVKEILELYKNFNTN